MVEHPNFRMVLLDEAGHKSREDLIEMLETVLDDLLYYATFLLPPWVLRVTKTSKVRPFRYQVRFQRPADIVEELRIKREREKLGTIGQNDNDTDEELY